MPFSTVCRRLAVISVSISLGISPVNCQVLLPAAPSAGTTVYADGQLIKIPDSATTRERITQMATARQWLSGNRPISQTDNQLIANWDERGPGNIAGRTRALVFDRSDLTHKKCGPVVRLVVFGTPMILPVRTVAGTRLVP